MDSYLSHHGIPGQKWGVRRYQNYDGTLTPAGRERKMYRDRTVRAGKTKNAVEEIIGTMTADEKDKLAIDEEGYLSFEQGSSVCKRILKKHGNTPAAFFDVLDDGDAFQLSMGTRSGKDFRGKGYASKAASEGVAWMNKNYSKYGKKKAVWGVRVDNKASIRIAEKNGFVLDKNSYSEDRKWVNYEKKFKHSLGGDSMNYDELVHALFTEEPPEDDHLEHHGILGMKWGVRRYQNEDGSLTPAGRERYQKGLAKELKETYKKHGPLAPISADAKNLAENSKAFRRYKETYAAPDNFLKSRREQLKSDKEYAKKYAKRYFEHERDLAKKSANSQEALDKMISIIDQDEKSVSWAKDSHLADEVIFFNEGDKYDKLIDENIKAAREWSKEHRRIAKDALGKYGDVKLRAKWDNKKYKTTASNFLKFALNYADVDPSINNGMDYSKLVHALFSDEDDDHLEHHGILGMKWYHRRFQNEDGSLTPAGRERYGVGEAREGSSDKPKKPGIVERHKQKKEEKRKAAEKAARVKRMQEGKAKKAEERKAAEEHEAAKQKALRSAKASEIMKYRDELTDQEMRDAVARIGWDEALRKKAKEENPDKLTKAMKVVDKYGKAAGSIATATENTTKMYNNIAKALNTFTGSDWPLVGEKRPTQNEIIRDNEQTKQAQIKTATDREKLKQERKRTEGFIDPSELQNQNNQNDNSGSDKPNNKPNNDNSGSDKPNNKPNNDKGPSKKDKENFEKAVKEGAKILGEAAKKVNEESKKQAKDKHDWTVDDKPASNASSSSSSNDKSVFDTKSEYSDAKAERAEQIGRDAVERYLQFEDKRKG